jgi:hypothetical protein
VTASEEGLGGLRGEAEGRYAGEGAVWLAGGSGDSGVTGGYGKPALQHEEASRVSKSIAMVYMWD